MIADMPPPPRHDRTGVLDGERLVGTETPGERAERRVARTPVGRRYAGASFLAVLLALLVRATRLGDSLWYDEIAAWRDHGTRGLRSLGTWGDPANHLLQTVLSWASVQVTGPALGETLALRLPPLLASLALVACAPWIARSWRRADLEPAGVRARPLGVALAVLVAVAPVLVLAGTEARGYPFMVLGAALGLAGLDRTVAHGFASRDGRRGAAVGIAAFALGTWAHPMTAFAAFGAAAALALESIVRRDRAPFVRGMTVLVPAGLLSLLLYAPILGDLRRSARLFSNDSGRGPSLLGPEGLDAVLQLGGTWSNDAVPWLALPGLALVVGGTLHAVRTGRGWTALRWFAGAPVAVAVLGALGTWIYARFLLFAVPGALVLAALPLAEARHLRRPARAAAGLLALLVLAAWIADLATRPERQPLRWAAAEARAAAADDGTVVVLGLRHRVMEAYLGDLGPRLIHVPEHGGDARLITHALDRADDTGPLAAVIVLYPDRIPRNVERTLDRRLGPPPITGRRPGWIDQGRGRVEVRLHRPPTPPPG